MTAAAAILLAATFTRAMERVSTVDPAMARSVYDARAVSLLYEPPLSIDYAARPYRLAPGFCELPSVSPDGLKYVFRRRRRERPVALDARDMAASLERLRDPATVSPNAWLMKDVASVAAKDADAVEIVLKRRCHHFPWLMAMPAASVRGADGSGSGAYLLSRWRRNHEMVFSLRPETAPGDRCSPRPFDTVRYLVVDDASTQWLMFLKGELDLLGEISRDNFDTVVGPRGGLSPDLAALGISLHTVTAFEVMHIGFNMEDPVVGRNRKLRQALNAAFDYPAWERFYNGRIMPCGTPVPPGVGGRLETPFPYAYDPELAARLLAEAGYPGGTDPATGRRLTLTLSLGAATQESREAGELMASFFEKAGVKLELDFKTWDAFMRAVNDGRFQMFRMGWVGDYPDAQNFLQLFHSSNRSPGPNHTAYRSEEYDREYDAALAAATDEDRNRRWIRCQEILREDCPWIFTHFNRSFSLVRRTVGNYRPTAFPDGTERWYEKR